MSGSVKAIDKASVHRITSGQVIVDLCSAVKELVENALDAGATSLEVRSCKLFNKAIYRFMQVLIASFLGSGAAQGAWVRAD